MGAVPKDWARRADAKANPKAKASPKAKANPKKADK